jgi:hypothetical protein
MEKNKKVDLSKLPDAELPAPKEDFRKTFQWRIFRIMAEFIEGFEFVADFEKSVTVFGSTSFDENNVDYKKARKFGELLAGEGFKVISGGGPGIMEAANRGAYEAGGESVGINIQIENEERRNNFLTKSIGFYYFFTRKVMLSYASAGYVFFPGGFGTLDELFEMITLIQTKKLPFHGKIVIVGKDFWEPLISWIKEGLCNKYKTIKEENLDIFILVDTPEEAMEIIKNDFENKRKTH